VNYNPKNALIAIDTQVIILGAQAANSLAAALIFNKARGMDEI
jgi:hypothetical protein